MLVEAKTAAQRVFEDVTGDDESAVFVRNLVGMHFVRGERYIANQILFMMMVSPRWIDEKVGSTVERLNDNLRDCYEIEIDPQPDNVVLFLCTLGEFLRGLVHVSETAAAS